MRGHVLRYETRAVLEVGKLPSTSPPSSALCAQPAFISFILSFTSQIIQRNRKDFLYLNPNFGELRNFPGGNPTITSEVGGFRIGIEVVPSLKGKSTLRQ